jgi:hypothetical protein
MMWWPNGTQRLGFTAKFNIAADLIREQGSGGGGGLGTEEGGEVD